MKTHNDDKRSAIIQAALDCFSKNGFHSSPISLIAREAGVGAGTIYRYFSNKDDLIEQIHVEIDNELRPAIEKDSDPQGPIRHNLLRILENLFDYLVTHPVELKFLEQYYHSPYGAEKKREEDRPLYALFTRGKQEGLLREIPEDILCALTIGPIVFLARDHMQGALTINRDMIQMTLEGCWNAIGR